ncbi:MAG TPA: hypothetical protein VFT50_16620, partial [Baekduia sp.]|nr:hypothetical protein [Baekduia sp.]
SGSGPGLAVADRGGWPPAVLLVVVAVVALVAAAAATLAARRRRALRATGDAELAELRAALARTGRAPTPDLTLHRLEQLLAGSTEARAYLRALRLARYGPEAGTGGTGGPTPAQRRALRRELGAGLGLRGRLRAAWALPPRPRELVGAGHRSPYTA